MKKILHYLVLVKCKSLNNQPCKIKPALIDINFNEPLYYSSVVSVNKCGGNCNTTDDPYARMYAPDKVKNMNVKVFNVKGK